MAIERIRELSYTRRETMKKQIVNNKVLRGVAIAMSVMMAITSVPVGSLAADNGTEENTEQAVTIEEAINAVDKAEKEVEEHFEETKEESQIDQAVLDELNQADEALNKIDSDELQLVIALVESDEVGNELKTLDKSLKSKELENANKDKAGDDRLHYDVERTESGELVTNSDGTPNVEDGEAQLQLSGQYGNDGRSVQGVYQSGMEEIQKAITAVENQEEDKAKESLAKAGEYLDAANDKLANSTQKLAEVQAQYDKAKEDLERIKNQLGDAVKYSNEASEHLAKAQEKAEKLEKMCNQYYASMLQYYSEVKDDENVSIATFDEKGKLDVIQSAAKADKLQNNSIVNIGSGFNGQKFFELNRELMEQLVTYKLEDEGATDIVFEVGPKGDPGNKSEKTAVITKDNSGNDKIGKIIDAGNHKWENVKDDNNGRNNHVMVTYKDKDGEEKTKYYNYVIKGKDNKYEGDNTHFENGPIYVAEITQDSNNVWHYAPYNPNNSKYLDNYNSLVKAANGYNDAKAAVDEAAEKVKKLQEELKTVQTKVSTNDKTLRNLASKLEKAQEAYNNSKDNLKDFQDVYEQMRRTLYPEEYSVEPDVVEPIEEEPITEPGAITTPGGADDPGDNEGDDSSDDTAPAEGGVAVLAASETFVLPARQNFTDVTTGPVNGVLGVRVNENNGGAEDQGTTQIADNQVARAASAMATNDKIDKAKKNSTKQNVKKVNDSEIPLADMPNMDEDGMQMNWMWLLIIFLLGATGKKMYDEYKKKKEEEETRRNKASM